MPKRPLTLLAVPLGGLFALTALLLLVSASLLHPPAKDLLLLGVFLIGSGLVTLGLGYAVTVVGLGKALRTVRGKLVFLLLLASAFALVNVGFTARLMFISSHDLALLAVLLAFSLGMSVFFALALSQSLNEGMQALVRTVRRIGAGELSSRVASTGRDELEELTQAFNAMAAQVEATFAQQKDLETARRQLIAAVSHDLRTPLASMRAMVESINDGVVSDPETVRRYLHTLQAEIEYLSRLIDDLFDLSQIDTGLLALHLEPASLRDLISDTLEGLTPQARRKGTVLQGEVPEALPPVVMDTRRVQRVLYNLLQNALRHTPPDGSVVIRAEDAGAEVRVSVADTGEGIPVEDLSRIFERFHKGDRARSRDGSGAGLGLSIAKGIVEAHGGRIWAESVPGRGATFTFALPKRALPIP